MNEKEMLEKYGNQKVKFSSYYKYSFRFKNENISVEVGGNHEDIYRLSVVPDKEYLVKDLPVKAISDNGECVYSDYF